MDCLKICLNSELISISPITKDLYKYNRYSPYSISHQFALWNKEYFMSNVNSNESPWENEIYGSNRINENNHKIHTYIKGSLGRAFTHNDASKLAKYYFYIVY